MNTSMAALHIAIPMNTRTSTHMIKLTTTLMPMLIAG